MKGTHQANGDYLSDDPAVNPMMAEWSVAYLKYCDGGSFTGLNTSRTVHNGTELYFRGRAVLGAMQQYLLPKMGSATDVVITGDSAGGLAAYLHVDNWASMLEAQGTTRVVGMPDSGFFPYYNGTTHFGSGMKWVFHHMNSTGGVPAGCIAAHTAEDASSCFFAENAARYIKTPCFALQSEYDSDQMKWAEIHGTRTENQWGLHLSALIEQRLLGSNSRHGVFLDSCSHHCWGWGLYRSTSGVTQPQAFQEWYDKGSEGLANKGYFRQNRPYPCDSCCHGS